MQSRNNSQSPTFNMSMASVAQSFQQNSKNNTLGIRNINTKQMNNLANDTKTWVATCRQMLIDMESKNIKTRAIFWTQFVNDTTSKTMEKIRNTLLESNIDLPNYPSFQYQVEEPLKHLRFLAEWTGLKTQQMQYMPKSYSEFEYKAKNWLNGRKAPNYALTLFPEMITNAEAYAEQHSYQIFHSNKQIAQILSTTLRYGYLARLCSAKISLNDTGRKTPLLIENSIKTAKSTTSKIFQRYAIDHAYPSQFPSHTSEAASYFDAKYNECLARVIKAIANIGNQSYPPNNIMPTIPSLPLSTIPMPQIPLRIPALSADNRSDSHSIPTPNNTDTNPSFQFSMSNGNGNGVSVNNKQMFTISDVQNKSGSGSVVSPNSNSTFNSGSFHVSSPSASMNSPHTINPSLMNNVLLPARHFNNLVTQLNRLTETQNSQKDTIHQLVTRLHSLEARMDGQQRLNQQQFGVAGSNQSVSGHSDQFWNTNNLNGNGNNTPSIAHYSLAADFANANGNGSNTGDNTPNLAMMANLQNINKFPIHVNSNNSLQTPTTNSSDTPPVLHSQFSMNNFQSNDGDIDIRESEKGDGDDNQSTMPFVGNMGNMMFENNNDILMFSNNPNTNTFPAFI